MIFDYVSYLPPWRRVIFTVGASPRCISKPSGCVLSDQRSTQTSVMRPDAVAAGLWSFRPVVMMLALFCCHKEYCEDVFNTQIFQPREETVLTLGIPGCLCVFKAPVWSENTTNPGVARRNLIFFNAVNWELDSVFAVWKLYKWFTFQMFKNLQQQFAAGDPTVP